MRQLGEPNASVVTLTIATNPNINGAKVSSSIQSFRIHSLYSLFNSIECGCSNFVSNFLCAACNNHWEQHETFIERGNEREQQKLPTGEFYMPFAELPDMQQVILTGSDTHMPSPYLDAAPKRSIQQGGDMRGRRAALRKFDRACCRDVCHAFLFNCHISCRGF